MDQTIRLLAAVFVGALVVMGGVVATGMGGASSANDAQPAEGPVVAPATSSNSGPTGHHVAVSANGEAKAEPDTAQIRVAVEATADDPATARDRVAQNVSSMRAALREAGITDDQVQTTEFDVHRTHEEIRREGADKERVRYRASHGFRIDASVDRAGKIADVALNNGATSVQDIHFTLSTETRREIRKSALEDAMANARSQASTLADRANLTITGVRSVSTGGADVHEPQFERALATPTAGSGGGTELESGPVTVRVSVDVTYDAQR